MSDADEHSLVEAAQRDLSKFGDLYERHFDRVYAYVVRRVQDRDAAEEVTAEVFHKALANLPRYQLRGAPFGAWLLKIDCQGKLDLKGRKWHVSRALAGEYVQLLPIQQRLMVFFCSTLMREIDLVAQRCTIVQRWATDPPTTTEM